MTDELKRHWCLFLSWLVALFSLISSLYLSEIRMLPICHLCWYQRVCLYPLAILLGIATVKNDKGIVPYVLPLSLLGAFFSLIQYLEQKFHLIPINICRAGPSCSDIHLEFFGFITLPLISFIVSIVISLLLLLAKRD